MINKLITRIQQTGAPIVVGLDPMMKFVPQQIQEAAYAQYGETLEGRRRPSGNTIRELWTPSVI